MSRLRRTAVCAAVAAAAWGAGALGQVQADDHPDDQAFALMIGVHHARFDHRWPAREDVDRFTFSGEPGRLYRARLTFDQPIGTETTQFVNGRYDDLTTSPQAQVVLHGGQWNLFRVDAQGVATLEAWGLAAADGSSVGYQLLIEDLGMIADDVPGTVENAHSLALGAWFDGTLSPVGGEYWSAAHDTDFYTAPTVAGRRYRIELENLDPTTSIATAGIDRYTDAVDPREGFSHAVSGTQLFGASTIDTLVDGRLSFWVAGEAPLWPAPSRYRVRLVDDGPAHTDDHSDWPYGATPFYPGVTVAATLGDRIAFDSFARAHDEDWFAVDLLAGHHYRARSQSLGTPTPGSWATAALLPPSLGAAVWSRAVGETVHFKVPGSGRYLLRTAIDGGVMRCSFVIDDLGEVPDDYTDSPALAAVVPPGGTSGVIESSIDADIFRIDVPGGSTVRVTLAPGLEGDSSIDVLLVNGVQFNQWAGTGGSSPNGQGVEFEAVIAPGEAGSSTWISVAPSYSAGTEFQPRAYRFSYQIVAPGSQADDWPDTADGARVLLPGERVAVRRNGDSDQDVFLADLVAGHTYRFLFGARVIPAAGLTQETYSYWSHIVQPTITGRFQVVYQGNTNEAGYDDLGVLTDDHPWSPNPQRLSSERRIDGAIDFQQDADTFRVVLDEEGVYELEMTARHGASAQLLLDGRFNQNFASVYGQGTYEGQPTTVTAPFTAIRRAGQLPPLTLTVADAGAGEYPLVYSVRVHLVQPFRPSTAGGQTPQEATPIAIGEHAAARRTRAGQEFWYRVPVQAGHLYAGDWANAYEGLIHPMEVFDGSLVKVCDLADRWVAGADGWAYLHPKSDEEWHRFLVRDLGPASDDAPATVIGARAAALGETITGSFDFNLDVDAYRLPLVRSERYVVLIGLQGSPAGASESSVDLCINDPGQYYQPWFIPVRVGLPTPVQLSGWAIESGLLAVRNGWNYPGLPAPASYTVRIWRECPADIAGPGASPNPDGVADNNDVIYFIDRFFAADPIADIGGTGAAPHPDGFFDNNDLVVYIDRLFAGCP